MTNLTVQAVDQSTYVVTAAFTDEDGAAVTPTTITWTLTDGLGEVVNDQEDISISVPAASNDIVLFGDDLAYDDDGSERVFTIEATYTSSLGTGLPLRAAAHFSIGDLEAVE